MNITWEADVPEDIRAIVAPHLEKWWGLVPTWCQEFIVRIDPDRDALMAISVNYRARWAVLRVTGQWLAADEEARQGALVHEMVHVNLEPMTHPMGKIIDNTMEKEGPARSMADNMYLDGIEASVEDLARGILRMVLPGMLTTTVFDPDGVVTGVDPVEGTVTLRHTPGICHTLTVNGRRATVYHDDVTYEEILDFAYGSRPHPIISVTYSEAAGLGHGVMLPKGVVQVQDGTVFIVEPVQAVETEL